MNLVPGRVRRASSNPWVVVSANMASIGGFLLTAVLARWPDLLRTDIARIALPVAFGIASLSSILLAVFVFHISQTLRAFRRACKKLHEIAHVYRDHLAEIIQPPASTSTEGELWNRAVHEVQTLSIVAQKVADAFSGMVGRHCMVEVYACERTDQAEVATVVAKSEYGTDRDRNGDRSFAIDPDRNTAFTEARKEKPSGQTSHFFSDDLIALEEQNGYKDERKNWRYLYKSRMVVPIRFREQEIGFLSVDTAARHRLNDTFHVELLASFADDMYLFLHLSRARAVEDVRILEAISRNQK